MAKTSDALIIGGGHNGLVCAAYLAAAGDAGAEPERCPMTRPNDIAAADP